MTCLPRFECCVDGGHTKPDDSDGEGWYLLRPKRALAWLESDYVKSATRFDFDS